MTKTTQEPKYTNRLAQETSPYLLQHAHNPVDWYPWGAEALHRATQEDKPILLSIGYSACHWCHVMERESFENPEIAKLMNEHFVCIKVDREERPDLDSIYMAATVTLNHGRGGWPMTVFLTPKQQPFFAGTYFPPEEKQGTPGFPTILQALNNAWMQDRQGILEQAKNLTTHLLRTERENRFRTIGPKELAHAAQQLEQSFDGIYGGFSPAPKFPAAAAISLLLRRYSSHEDTHALHMATHTLDRMALGGLYDQLGGGFARYSTDEKWLVPHFEKMLYDNALLIRTYCEAWQLTHSPLYARVIRETLDFVLREFTQDSGGFSSALDADTEGEEGLYYVWEKSELASHLSADDAELFAELYDVTEEGNWENKNVLHLQRSLEDEALQRGEQDVPAFLAKVDSIRDQLFKARQARTKPNTDDKVLTAWNGMMIGAMALGFQVTGDERYLNAAVQAADFVENQLTHEGKLLRTYRDGKAHLNAYLEDYAHMGEALIDLYEASGDGRYLSRATKTLETMLSDFGEPGGGSLYMTASNHEELIFRKREGYDGATPSPNAVAAIALLRVAAHLGRQDLHHEGLAAIEAWGQSITEMPRAFSKILHAVDFILEGPTQIAITGDPQAQLRTELIQSVHQAFTPNAVIAWEHAHNKTMQSYEGHPLLVERSGQPQAQVHVCRDFTCHTPATNAEAVLESLKESVPQNRFSTLRRPLAGMATAAATRARAETCFPAQSIKALGKTNLNVTPVGFGSYRVIDEDESHRQALEDALSAGINLIDTSTNYSDGRSERLIGRVLSSMVRAGNLSREEVVVVSKVGYIQGSNLLSVKKRSQPFKDVVEYNDSLWHCIHPDFIEEQISESTQRLSLKTLDICLLHNPEYFLLHAQRVGGGTRPQLVSEMQRRLKEAFTQLEKERKTGRIGYYGISSNTFADKGQSFTTLSISDCMDIAHDVAGEEHGFRVIQLPFNLIEAGALCERNTGVNTAETPLEYAQSHSLGVLVNRPLNAIVDGSIVRLTTPTPTEPPLPYHEALTNLHVLEQEIRTRVTGEVYLGGETFKLEDFFYFAVEFEDYGNQSHNKTSWDEIEYRVVNQRLNRMVEFMQKNLQDGAAKAWQTIFPDYRRALTLALEALRHRADKVSLSQSTNIADAVSDAIPSDRQDAPLSQKALWLTQNVDGISSVLCGMRTPAYVGDVLALKGWEPKSTPPEVFESLNKIETALNKTS